MPNPPAATEAAEPIIEAVVAGELDVDLMHVLNALNQRLVDLNASTMWAISLPDLDLEVTEDDLSLGEYEDLEKQTGRSWATINPVIRAGDAVAIVAVTLRHRHGLSEQDAADKARGLPGSLFAGAIRNELRRGATPKV